MKDSYRQQPREEKVLLTAGRKCDRAQKSVKGLCHQITQYACAYAHACVYLCVHVCAHACVLACVYVCLFECMFVVCVCFCVLVCVFVCMCLREASSIRMISQ